MLVEPVTSEPAPCLHFGTDDSHPRAEGDFAGDEVGEDPRPDPAEDRSRDGREEPPQRREHEAKTGARTKKMNTAT